MPLDPITQTAITTLVKESVSRGIAVLASKFETEQSAYTEIEEAIGRHLTNVIEQVSRMHIFGMTAPEETSQSTIPLAAKDLPRRFSSRTSRSRTLEEVDLITEEGNIVLLGDPGAGKTTTLKRLAHRILTSENLDERDIWSFPILVTCRQENWEDYRLFDIVADKLGIPIDLSGRSTKSSTGQGAGAYDLDEQRRRHLLALSIADAGPAIILIDGVDEVPAEKRKVLEFDIERLGDELRQSKVIATCRSADYNHVEGYTILELCPLEPSQIKEVAELWLGHDASEFTTLLASSTIHDLASRPLFLAQLLILFRNRGSIPDQPSSVYRMIVRLLLQDWDEQKRVRRSSSYAHFHVDDKLEFLSALSYELTTTYGSLQFSTRTLEQLYLRIAPRFGLPLGDSEKVARELESHTGIVVESGNSYEFSHRSLQEYLCGYYIVRQPMSTARARHLAVYPDVVAVATTLSSNPGNWLTSFIVSSCYFNGDESLIATFAFPTRPREPSDTTR